MHYTHILEIALTRPTIFFSQQIIFMNKIYSLLLLTTALGSTIIGCSDEAKYKSMEQKYNALQTEKAKHKAKSTQQMATHSDEEMHHDMAMPAGLPVAHTIDTNEIGRNADDLPPPLIAQSRNWFESIFIPRNWSRK